MAGFVDLHCHCIPGIDDGVRSAGEARELLAALADAGFARVVATPHMRPGMFDNTRESITAAFEHLRGELPDLRVPELEISCEHYFDDVVFSRLLTGAGLPYPGGRSVLIELYDMDLSPLLEDRLFDLKRRKLLPVIAHPERYPAVFRSPERLSSLVERGAAALLDTAALLGKYGREPQRCAERLLDEGVYQAACTDAHRPADVADSLRAIRLVEARYGAEEVAFLLREGPGEILEGVIPS